MRFIHIADVHLGMQPDAGFPWSEERGEAIWESFRRIIRLAGREKTDFLLIAGDLFQCQPITSFFASASGQIKAPPPLVVIILLPLKDSTPYLPNVPQTRPLYLLPKPSAASSITGMPYFSNQ